MGLTGIIPFTYIGGLNKAAGSTFLRATGLAESADDFEIWKHGHKYDNLIFQKAYWREMMEAFKGPKVLDLCDPDWITGSMEVMETAMLVDAITCSSENLAGQIRKYLPGKIVWHVPDRLNFSVFPSPRTPHEGRAKEIVWFGFINNAHVLLPRFASCINELGLSLTIISDFPYSKEDEIAALRPRFIKYDQETAYSLIKEYDIVLNPRSEHSLFKYKSNNKTIISWRLGCPVAETPEDLETLLDAGNRNKQTGQQQRLIAEEYDIKISVCQYRSLIAFIEKNLKS